MQVEIIFKDAAKPKQIECDNVYTKGEMLCIRQGEYIYKYPLMNIFSVCHKHGCHIGSIEHQKKNNLIWTGINKMTNADRIRNMSNDKLAKELVVPFMFMCGYLPNCVFQSNHCEQFNDREEAWKAELEWLESEANNGNIGE